MAWRRCLRENAATMNELDFKGFAFDGVQG